MNILLSNDQMDMLGGSQTWTVAVAHELIGMYNIQAASDHDYVHAVAVKGES